MTVNGVSRVQVVVTLSSGDMHSVVVDSPYPSGGNPRFLSTQIDNALSEAGDRLGKIAETYAPQIKGAPL